MKYSANLHILTAIVVLFLFCGIYDGQHGVDPDKRVFLLTRSGFSGLQRYSTATWSGDIATRWEDMEAQIAAGLNFAVSGIPY